MPTERTVQPDFFRRGGLPTQERPTWAQRDYRLANPAHFGIDLQLSECSLEGLASAPSRELSLTFEQKQTSETGNSICIQAQMLQRIERL